MVNQVQELDKAVQATRLFIASAPIPERQRQWLLQDLYQALGLAGIVGRMEDLIERQLLAVRSVQEAAADIIASPTCPVCDDQGRIPVDEVIEVGDHREIAVTVYDPCPRCEGKEKENRGI